MTANFTESAKKSAVPDWKLTVGGSTMTAKSGSLDLEEIVVDELSDGPSMAYARFNTADLEWIDKGDLKLEGSFKVDLGFGDGADEKPELVFTGSIHGWEPVFHGKTPATIVVRAFNKLHKASRGRRTGAWLDKKLSEVASGIAGKYGMGTGGVECTKIVQPYIYQANVTDLDFLREMTERVGYEVGCDVNDDLRFRKPKTNDGPVATLIWGDNLKRFKGRFNTGQPISNVTCTSWDAKQKKIVSGSAGHTKITSNMGGAKNSAQHAATFEKDSAKLYVHNRPFYSGDDARMEAEGWINQLAMQLTIAEAECEGTARAQAGKVVTIQGVGKRFDGQYYVIRCRHQVRPNNSLPDAGYTTFLTLRRTGATDG